MNRFIRLTFLLLIFSLCSELSFARLCRIGLFRRVGVVSTYVYTCDCRKNVDMPFKAVGRASIPAFKPRLDTIGRNNAFLRCQTAFRRELEHICFDETPSFPEAAERVLKRCINEPMTEKEMLQTRRFKFSTDKCEAGVIVFPPGPATVTFCACKIAKRTFVVPGRGAALIVSSPFKRTKELQLIRGCIRTKTKQLQKVCNNSPEDFEVLSLHLLEACCKRIRKMFDIAKLECKAIVPDDLSPFLKK